MWNTVHLVEVTNTLLRHSRVLRGMSYLAIPISKTHYTMPAAECANRVLARGLFPAQAWKTVTKLHVQRLEAPAHRDVPTDKPAPLSLQEMQGNRVID